jgi:hypothetical protein
MIDNGMGLYEPSQVAIVRCAQIYRRQRAGIQPFPSRKRVVASPLFGGLGVTFLSLA